MPNDWLTYLQTQGGVLTDAGEIDFPADGDSLGCAISDLSHLGLIQISGPDARNFLQGQMTNDIREVSAKKSQLNSYCSPKGRMLASFRVFERDDSLFLQLPVERLEPILKRLQMFVLRSQVTLRSVNDLVCVGLSGACVLQLLTITPAAAKNSSITDAGLTVIRISEQQDRFMLIGPPDRMIEFWGQATTQEATPAPMDHWPLLDIQEGIPTILDDTAETFVPQMANLQLLDGISFTKGCYTGQEIVARMQYLGTLKRRMYRTHVMTEQRPEPGNELFSASSKSGQWAGKIVDARPVISGGFEALVVAEISSIEENSLHLNSPDGPVVNVLALPYSFEEQGQEG